MSLNPLKTLLLLLVSQQLSFAGACPFHPARESTPDMIEVKGKADPSHPLLKLKADETYVLMGKGIKNRQTGISIALACFDKNEMNGTAENCKDLKWLIYLCPHATYTASVLNGGGTSQQIKNRLKEDADAAISTYSRFIRYSFSADDFLAEKSFSKENFNWSTSPANMPVKNFNIILNTVVLRDHFSGTGISNLFCGLNGLYFDGEQPLYPHELAEATKHCYQLNQKILPSAYFEVPGGARDF